jgi:hypothetical protein
MDDLVLSSIFSPIAEIAHRAHYSLSKSLMHRFFLIYDQKLIIPYQMHQNLKSSQFQIDNQYDHLLMAYNFLLNH